MPPIEESHDCAGFEHLKGPLVLLLSWFVLMFFFGSLDTWVGLWVFEGLATSSLVLSLEVRLVGQFHHRECLSTFLGQNGGVYSLKPLAN